MKNLEAINACHEKIKELKVKLQSTDYLAIKFSEGELTGGEYAPTLTLRRAWRSEINLLEEKIEELRHGS